MIKLNLIDNIYADDDHCWRLAVDIRAESEYIETTAPPANRLKSLQS
jgi:hypothetical protein